MKTIEVTDMKELKWYHYCLAVAIFAAGPFLFGIVANLALSLINVLSISAVRNNSAWIFLLSEIIGCVVSVLLTDHILDGQKPVFVLSLCLIYTTLWVVIAIFSISAGDWWTVINDAARIAVYVFYIIRFALKKRISAE